MDQARSTDYSRTIAGTTPAEIVRNAEAAIDAINHRGIVWSFARVMPDLMTLIVADNNPAWMMLRILHANCETEEGRRQIAQILARTGSFGTLEEIEIELATSQFHYSFTHRQ